METTYFAGPALEVANSAGLVDYRHYIYANGIKIASYSRTSAGTNTLYYLREDLQGGVSGIIAADGTSFVKESFTAFGARRSACDWKSGVTAGNLALINMVTRHGYTWHTALGAMGLNDMNGRVQDAVTGRFLSADPYITEAGNTQNFNRYVYVYNNPLSYIDPSGFACDTKNRPQDSLCDGIDEVIVPAPGPPSDLPNWPNPLPLPPSLNIPLTLTFREISEAINRAQSQTPDPCTSAQANRSVGDKVSDGIVGFGDAFLIPIVVRNLFDINGTTDFNSSAYSAGNVAGIIEGLVPFALEGAAAVGGTRFGSIINSNRYFRIGPGRWGGDMVPRISSPSLPGDGHLSLATRLPPIPPVGALASPNTGCPGGK